MDPTNGNDAHRGWDSDFEKFRSVDRSRILSSLLKNYPNASDSEQASWKRNVPSLQNEVGEVVRIDTDAGAFTAILEYELPMESRRPDVVLLLNDDVVVVELKGKSYPSDADIDQTHAYARDLMCYHRDCHERTVHPVLVPTRMPRGGALSERDVRICGVEELDALVAKLSARRDMKPMSAGSFLSAEAYRPLPTLIDAARRLFFSKRPPQLWRSAANTDAAVETIQKVAAEARRTRTRRLVLLTGVPGAGKTLVGLRVAHSAVPGEPRSGEGGAPAVFLSGNGPLVEVLGHVLEGAGGGGKTFVRPIKEYVRRYGRNGRSVPPEHVIVFDEAQRAHDRARAADTHKIGMDEARSEPEYFIEFAERVAGWSVVVGLVGSGQEIHTGEEGGLGLWERAVAKSPRSGDWTVHGPEPVAGIFRKLDFRTETALSLDSTIRTHRASRHHEFVGMLVDKSPGPPEKLRALSGKLRGDGHDFRVTRDLERAKSYLRERYSENPGARFGIVASSRDRDLGRFGVANDFQSTRRVRFGPWYNDDETEEKGLSCRHLRDCVTEFGAQGLELDAVLLAWGTDFVLRDGTWSNEKARKYRKTGHSEIRDPWRLRANAYRVLLTRGRDAHVVFVPRLSELDETWEFLLDCGFRELRRPPAAARQTRRESPE